MKTKNSRTIALAVFLSILVAGLCGCSVVDKFLEEKIFGDEFTDGDSLVSMPGERYLGVWYESEGEQSNELTIIEIGEDTIVFNLTIERLASIDGTARIEGGAIRFTGKDPAGNDLSGTLEFGNNTITLSIDQAEWEYDLVQTLEFTYRKGTESGDSGGTNNYIYDADYSYTVPIDSYTTKSGEEYRVSDIVVPYINIDSGDAVRANAEIKDVFNRAIKLYKEGTNDRQTFVDPCNYISYLGEKSLSVYIVFGVGGTDAVHLEYYVYNFDLGTGRFLEYEEAYQLAGLNADNISGEAEWAIEHYMINVLQFNKQMYIEQNVKRYHDSVADYSIKFFLDGEYNLNLVMSLAIPVGSGEFDAIIKLMPEKEEGEEEIGEASFPE